MDDTQYPTLDRSAAGVPEPGSTLLGKYQVENLLGVGGMGVVVAAQHLLLEQKVAIKFLLPAAAADPALVERFSREARAAAKIRSEHVARVFDVGETESGAPFIVMEFLEGKSLAAHLKEVGRLEVRDAAGFLIEACEALAEAHVAGIVHRDLKPENLFLTRRPGGSIFVKVLDFGISKSLIRAGQAMTPLERTAITLPSTVSSSEAIAFRAIVASAVVRETQLTQSGVPMGTPYYMSPEQIIDPANVNVPTDIWALGTILFESLAGMPPFKSDTLDGVFAAILNADPPSLRAIRPEVPEAIEAVTRRCLARDPQQRFQNVAEFVKALMPFAPTESSINVERALRVLHGDHSSAIVVAGSADGRSRARRRLRAFGGALILAALASLAVGLSRQPASERTPAGGQGASALSQTPTPAPSEGSSALEAKEGTKKPKEATARPPSRPPPIPSAGIRPGLKVKPAALPPTPSESPPSKRPSNPFEMGLK